jgi:hypothetical protein
MLLLTSMLYNGLPPVVLFGMLGSTLKGLMYTQDAWHNTGFKALKLILGDILDEVHCCPTWLLSMTYCNLLCHLQVLSLL